MVQRYVQYTVSQKTTHLIFGHNFWRTYTDCENLWAPAHCPISDAVGLSSKISVVIFSFRILYRRTFSEIMVKTRERLVSVTECVHVDRVQ